VSVVQGPTATRFTFSGQRGWLQQHQLDGGDYINGFSAEQLGEQRAASDITGRRL
jgi:hypothetical protein